MKHFVASLLTLAHLVIPEYLYMCSVVILGNSPIATKLRLYAQVCRKLLGMLP